MAIQSPQPLRLERATAADQREAWELLFSRLAEPERKARLEQALAQGSQPLGLWVARRGQAVAAATMAQIQPGRTAAVVPPQAAPNQPPETAQDALGQLLDQLAVEGVHVVQTLLESDHGPDAELLAAGGFQNVSNLLYLVSLAGEFPAKQPRDGLAFEPYETNQHARLARLIEATYRGSLDCPALEGVRSTDDVLAGYRATGEFDPRHWLIASCDGHDVGCVLLAHHPQFTQWELVYMGVVPEARGRGFGLTIVRHAQWLAARAGVGRMVLAVDAANAPAIAMYASAGFCAWDHRSVFLRVL